MSREQKALQQSITLLNRAMVDCINTSPGREWFKRLLRAKDTLRELSMHIKAHKHPRLNRK